DRKTHLGGVETRPQGVAISFGRRKDTDRREAAEACAPELLASRERDERLGCSTISLPVQLVDRPHPAQCERKRRLPIMEATGLRDPWIRWRQITVRRSAVERNYLRQAKLSAVRM